MIVTATFRHTHIRAWEAEVLCEGNRTCWAGYLSLAVLSAQVIRQTCAEVGVDRIEVRGLDPAQYQVFREEADLAGVKAVRKNNHPNR
jgi:hypothetical protein